MSRRLRTTLKKLRIAADEGFGSETAKFLEFAQARLRREGASNSEWIETGLKATKNHLYVAMYFLGVGLKEGAASPLGSRFNK